MAKYKVIFHEDRCKGCELCVFACPKKIIRIDENITNKKGYYPAGITDADLCIGCISCALMCPEGVIRIDTEE